MKVILDSGPLMALAKLNLLPLLKKLYGEVCIPEGPTKFLGFVGRRVC